MIEGDYIQLREGAQKMVVATAAVAKVAAAAASSSSSLSSPYSSYLPTVAVTPMAQSHRQKKVHSVDSKNVKNDKAVKDFAVIPPNVTNEALKHQQTNGAGGNTGCLDRSSVTSAQNSGPTNGRTTSTYAGKQQAR